MLRLRQICLVASELEKPVADLKAIFGLETCFHDPNVAKYGLENALLPVGTDFLEVVAPFQEETAAGRYLDRRGGDGGYMVILQCDDAELREQRMPEIGVRIANRLDYGTYLGLQLHPKDTGGAILETSTDPRSVAPDGPWHPAGDSWEEAVRTDVVRAMTAVELQSDDPGGLAARWAEVLNVPLGNDAEGNPALKLENAELRFIPADDGRGEGLGGLDLAVADRDAILREAAARDCDVADDTVTVCGTRFKLL
jgi:hypothetical protein